MVINSIHDIYIISSSFRPVRLNNRHFYGKKLDRFFVSLVGIYGGDAEPYGKLKLWISADNANRIE